MELAFDTKELRALCESELQAKLELGPRIADALKHRLADIRAAKAPKDLVAGRPRALGDTGTEYMTLELCEGWRIVLGANHPSNPMLESGRLDWSKVSRVKILRIESDHG